jgi:hypothetical protein
MIATNDGDLAVIFDRDAAAVRAPAWLLSAVLATWE